MCIGQSLDGVGTEGGKERKEKLNPGDERESERETAANARNPITKWNENDDR